jgi:hypothetical protein
MKTKLLAALLCCPALLVAAPLTETTAVHTQPDPAAPAISFLKAGTEPVAAHDSLATTPAGWMAVELPGPFEGYVAPDGLSKNLDVRPGTPIRFAPKPDAPVLAIMEKGDKAEMTGVLRGKWTQVRLEKSIVGYIRITAPQGASLPAIATTPAGAPGMSMSGPAFNSPPVNATGPGHAVESSDGGSAALPRILQGKFVSTRRPFAPRRPFDYQINDDAGVRIAYVDVKKVAQGEQIEKYLDHTVVVSGVVHSVPEAKGIVIEADSLTTK